MQPSNPTSILLLLLSWTLVVAGPSHAQRGPGPTPLGRAGAVWQTDQALSREAMAEFHAELRELDADAWREKAVAWLRLEVRGAEADAWQVEILEKYRVESVDAGRKAKLETAPNGWLPWTASGAKKLPRSLDVTLNDVDATRVHCLLRGEAPEGSADLGVFLHEGQLLCAYRGADATS